MRGPYVPESVLSSICDESFHERHSLLLCSDVLCAQEFWREEVDGLRKLKTVAAFRPTARWNWQVGFLFWAAIEANAATEVIASQTVIGREKWAFLKFVPKN